MAQDEVVAGGDKPCPGCRQKGAAKKRCSHCGTVWCSRCGKSGNVGSTNSCPYC